MGSSLNQGPFLGPQYVRHPYERTRRGPEFRELFGIIINNPANVESCRMKRRGFASRVYAPHKRNSLQIVTFTIPRSTIPSNRAPETRSSAIAGPKNKVPILQDRPNITRRSLLNADKQKNPKPKPLKQELLAEACKSQIPFRALCYNYTRK